MKRNCTIDIFRLVFAILIAALHTSPFIEINSIGSYIFSQVLSRLAVPFFAAVAGYFFFLNGSKRKYLQSIKKYVLIYTFWSVLMYLYDAVRWNGTSSEFAIYVLKTYFLTGWNHLWYLLAIIYTIILLAFANHISQKAEEALFCFSFVPLAVGIAINNYGNVFLKLPGFRAFNNYSQSMIVNWWFLVIPFFMLGYALNKKIPECHRKKAFSLAMISFSGLLIEVALTTWLDLHENVILCLFTYPVIYFLLNWALNNPNAQLMNMAKYCAGMASVVYFGHVVIANCLKSVNVSETPTFLICILITTIMGYALTGLDNPIINKLI